eukprot:gb/GECH01014967.1/.p1 GENE.gb/GECH01014967.1/~~gb/GECH01014967.1/.p1  ORF type:complete len:296 (+),score=56.35 gb/GECH01014967.1/:1-888(+)
MIRTGHFRIIHTHSPMTKISHSLNQCIDLSYKAGKIALDYRQRPNQNLDVVEKPQDAGPATEADRAVDTFLVDELRNRFPEALVVGEESSTKSKLSDFSKGTVFFVDSIDGTKEFIKNNGEWAVMIGMAIDGEPQLGVVFQPDGDRLYYGSKGNGAFLIPSTGSSPKPIHAEALPSPKDAVCAMSRSHPDERVTQLMKEIGSSNTLTSGSLGVKATLIASGQAHVYFNLNGKSHFWDTCGSEVILREAGGCILSSQGEPIKYYGTETQIQYPFVFAASPDLGSRAVSAMQKIGIK